MLSRVLRFEGQDRCHLIKQNLAYGFLANKNTLLRVFLFIPIERASNNIKLNETSKSGT